MSTTSEMNGKTPAEPIASGGPTAKHFAQGFEFDHLSQRPMYARCPSWLISRAEINQGSVVADLGCGSGILTESILGAFPDDESLRIWAIDPSEWELSIAKSRVNDSRVKFLQAYAQEAVEQGVKDCDAVFLCNILHQIPLTERTPVLKGSYDLLRPGGKVALNTLFYADRSSVANTMFNIRWLVEARDILGAMDSADDVMPDEQLPAYERLTPDEHRKILEEVGFERIEVEEVPFDWELDDWIALSKYSVFIRGALWPSVDLEKGKNALIEGATRAFYIWRGDARFVKKGTYVKKNNMPKKYSEVLPLKGNQNCVAEC